MKKILIILTLVFSLFIFKSNVFAYTDNLSTIDNFGWPTVFTFCQDCYGHLLNYNGSTKYWANREGNVLFTFTYQPICSGNSCNSFISDVTINSGSQEFVCNIGNIGSYRDSGVAFETYSAVCPIQMNSNGLTRISFGKDYGVSGNVRMSAIISFYDNDNDLASVINAINTQGSNIYNILGEINSQEITRHNQILSKIQNSIDDMNSQFNSIKSKLDNINTNTQATTSAINSQTQQQQDNYDEFKNSDISESDKIQPDDSDYQDYKDKEDQLFDKMDNADLNQLDIAIDSDSSNWVWNTMQSILHSHSLLFTFFISILSVGIIKLALAR